MKLAALSIFSLFIHLKCYAIANKETSPSHIENNIELLLEKGENYFEQFNKIDTLIFYYEKTLPLLKQTNDINSLIRVKLALIKIQLFDAKFKTALKALNEILPKATAQKSPLIGKIHHQFGIVYYRMGDKEKAMKAFLQAVTYHKKNNDYDNLVLSYCSISDITELNGLPKVSISYKNKAISLLPKMTNAFSKLSAYSKLSSLYLYLRSNDNRYLDSSLFYAFKAFELTKELGCTAKMNEMFFTISDVYQVQKKYDKAIEYNLKSIPYRAYLAKGEIILFYTKMTDCLTYLKQYDNALVYLDSVKQTLKLIDSQYYRLAYYERLYECNKQKGDKGAALSAFEQYTVLKDSLFNIEKTQSIDNLAQKYNQVENEKEILRLSKEKEIGQLSNRLLAVAIFAALLTILILIGLYRRSINRNRHKLIETELRLNRARMDPHFFFNIMASIQNLSLKEGGQKTSDMLANFSKIIRKTLESTYVEHISLEEEISFLTQYLELQKLRYPEKFIFAFEVDSKIDEEDLRIPSLIIQPFVENAIEHGFKNINYLGKITVKFHQVKDYILITINDNGTTFSGTSKNKEYPSRATQIIKDRLYLLNAQQKKTATVTIENNTNQLGHNVIIKLPLNKQP